MMASLHEFPLLQASIAHVESWKSYLNACQEELCNHRAEDSWAATENAINIGIQLGELLPPTWRATFHRLFESGTPPWSSVREFEACRQRVRALFYKVREVMDLARQSAEKLTTLTGRHPSGLDRLFKIIEEVRGLEENVFHDWPSFIEPWCAADPLPVDESLAATLGIPAEEARQKMDARRQQLRITPE